MLPRLWDPRPYEHRSAGLVDLPAGGLHAFAQNITAHLIHVPDFRDAFLRPLECGNRRDLNGREYAVIQVRLDAPQRMYELRLADHEAHAPSGHIVALG